MNRLRIEKLLRLHPVEGFDSGQEPLDQFLRRYALPNQQANASQTSVVVYDDVVIGYYTLTVGEWA